MTTIAEPPSIWTAATAVDDRRPRSKQTQLGASETVCEMRAAHRIAGTEPTDPTDKKMAILGTYIHEGLLTAARTEYGWLVEKATASELVRGHVDAVQLDAETAARLPKRLRPVVPSQDGVTVEDVKTKSTYKWDQVLRYGATAAEIRQTYLYAGMLRERGFEDRPGQRQIARLGPLNVQRIRLRFINRDNGSEFTQEFAFDEFEAATARWWVEQVHALPGPHAARRDFDGPGLDAVCDYCPVRTACWGMPARPGIPVQTNLVHDDKDREQALADYVAGAEQEKAGKKVKDLARKKLDNSPAGDYGPNRLKWTGGNAAKSTDVQAMVDLHEEARIPVPMIPDAARMEKNLKDAGIAVPQRENGKLTARSINVSPVPAAKPSKVA
ncbi:PD-(D/E)XK nuclease family protein [Streptacidiphilus cavernicola]|uniref:PD-(D/E)XK nuclease family protein n=1 Tax=Streptacidiphilus cavernicola TaxID=3342716 RepID=A0ABV6VNY8_9ACTN